LPTGSHERNLVLEIAADARRSTIVRPRLPPFATDVSRYRFDLQERGPVHVAARLMVVPAIGIPREISGTATVCIPDDNGP
jgi:hypothetical protein